MKNMLWWVKSVFVVVLLSSVLAGGVYYILQSKGRYLVSPAVGGNRDVAGENLWLPEVERETYKNTDGPEISAKSAFFIELESGKMLYGKDIFKSLLIASLVKIMTSIVTLEHIGWEERLLVSERAASMEPDEMMLLPNEIMTVRELMQGLFLVSANDAAEVFAEKTTGSRDEFISLMNKKAFQLGMRDSRFINPTGLEEDGNSQFSSAYDVALMSRYLVTRWPEVLDITRQYHIVIPASVTHQDYDMYSGINLLTSYPGVMGLKTGYTPEAGLTLVTLAKRDGHTILGVLLGSENRREDAKTLLDFSFAKLGVKI